MYKEDILFKHLFRNLANSSYLYDGSRNNGSKLIKEGRQISGISTEKNVQVEPVFKMQKFIGNQIISINIHSVINAFIQNCGYCL